MKTTSAIITAFIAAISNSNVHGNGNPESILGVGGTELPEGLRPFLVGLAFDGDDGQDNGCGGSLIGEKVVLTAARKSTFSTQYPVCNIFCTNTLLLILFLFLDCLTAEGGESTNATAYEAFEKVNVGVYDYGRDVANVDYTSFDLCDKEEGVGCDVTQVAYGIRHPLWTPGRPGRSLGGGKVGFDYDFALIFLPSADYNTNAIKPVMLNTDPNIPKAGDEVNTFGWGKASASGPCPAPTPTENTYSPTYEPEKPRTANLSYLTPEQCNEQTNATESMLCAESAEACLGKGDSGK